MKHVTTENQSTGWDADPSAWERNSPPMGMREISPSVHNISVPSSRAPSSHGSASEVNLFESPPAFYSQLSDTPKVRPTNFAMWVGSSSSQGGGVDCCYHTYTRLSHDDAVRPAALIASIPEWKTRFPHVAQVLENAEPFNTCPILHFEASISVMSELPTQPSILCTEFEVAIPNNSGAPPSSYERQDWECVTRIYAPGKKVWELSLNVEATTALDGSKKLTLPFASDFWAAFYTGLSSAQQGERSASTDQNERLRRRRMKECKSAIRGITVVQELFSSSTLSGAKEQEALFIWDFVKAEPGQVGKTTWRAVAPPGPVVPAVATVGSPSGAGAVSGGRDMKLDGPWMQVPLSPFCRPLSPMPMPSYYMAPHNTPNNCSLYHAAPQTTQSIGDVNYAFDMHQPCSLPPFTTGMLTSATTTTALSDPSDYFSQWPRGFSSVPDPGRLHVV